jgi:hypothetical protein
MQGRSGPLVKAGWPIDHGPLHKPRPQCPKAQTIPTTKTCIGSPNLIAEACSYAIHGVAHGDSRQVRWDHGSVPSHHSQATTAVGPLHRLK